MSEAHGKALRPGLIWQAKFWSTQETGETFSDLTTDDVQGEVVIEAVASSKGGHAMMPPIDHTTVRSFHATPELNAVPTLPPSEVACQA